MQQSCLLTVIVSLWHSMPVYGPPRDQTLVFNPLPPPPRGFRCVYNHPSVPESRTASKSPSPANPLPQRSRRSPHSQNRRRSNAVVRASASSVVGCQHRAFGPPPRNFFCYHNPFATLVPSVRSGSSAVKRRSSELQHRGSSALQHRGSEQPIGRSEEIFDH